MDSNGSLFRPEVELESEHVPFGKRALFFMELFGDGVPDIRELVADIRSAAFSFMGEKEMRLYSLLDTAALEYGPVMQFQNDAVARRWLQMSLPAQSVEVRRPEDFVLMFLGVMGMETGVIASSSPVPVGPLADILRGPVPSAEEMADGSR